LALTGVLGIGEGHLFHHRKARRLVSGDFAKSGSLFQDFLSAIKECGRTTEQKKTREKSNPRRRMEFEVKVNY
ncbi:hypothetical protein, partial [Pseudomonas shirazica]|uniref:hypothetical protein n=1 Tax=Pseudomonas shirazica TaxID=1940636 RepID=UPI003AB05AC9